MAERSEAVEEQAVRDVSAVYSVESEIATAEDAPLGYKRTEVGVIPEDWRVEALAYFVSALHAGVSVNSSAADQPVDDVPAVLKTSCIQAGIFFPDQAKPITPKDRSRAKLSPKAETILISRMNTPNLVGESGFVGKDYDHLFLPDRIWMTIFRQTVRFSPRWLAYILSSPEYRKYLKEIATGTSGSMKNIAKGSLLNLKVPCPVEKEQRAIATALSDADALIASLDRLIAKKRAIKQAAMQQLLTGQTRLPGFTGEWETKRLGDVGTFYKGQGIRRDDVSDEGVPCIRYGEIYTRYGDCVLTPKSRIPNAVAEAAFPLRTGDILFAGSGETTEEIGMCVAYLGEQPAFAGGDIVVLRPNEGDSAYLGRLLNHPTIAQQKARLGQGDAVVHISARNLAQIEVHLPKQEEQTAIATLLSDMDTEIETLERRRDKARQIKQGMMQQLLTGQVRLVDSAGRKLSNRKPRSGQRKANVHFMRSVFAAEIVDQLHQEPTFGHVKMQKVLFLAEHLCDVDIGSSYHRKAAGPYDNRALRSIDSQMKKQQWFEARKKGERYRYVPLEKRGNHKAYFDRYFHHVSELFRSTVEPFRKLDTERCEIVATLYSAWDDLLCDQATVSDEMIIHEVQNNWHESKKRIPKDRWSRALQWMRENGFVPKRRLPNEQ